MSTPIPPDPADPMVLQAPLVAVHFAPGVPAAVTPMASLSLQLLAMCGVAVGWYGLVQLPSSDVAPFVVGLAGLGLGLIVANLAEWPQRFFRVLPAAPVGLVAGLVTAMVLSLTGALLTSGIRTSSSTWERPTLLISLLVGAFGTSLDWRRADRLRMGILLSSLGLVTLIVNRDPVGPVTVALWLGIMAVVMRQSERAADRSGWRLPSFQYRRITDGGEVDSRSSVAALLLGGALMVVLVVANLRPNVPDVSTPEIPPPTWLGRIVEVVGKVLASLADRFPQFSFPDLDLPWIGNVSLPDFNLLTVVQIMFAVTVALVLAAALTPLYLWLARRVAARRARPWAIRFAERIAKAGRRRGCARARGESLERYLITLSTAAIPDARLAAVGPQVSYALFAPGPHDRVLTDHIDGVVDEVLRDHPVRAHVRDRTTDSMRQTGRAVRSWIPGRRRSEVTGPPAAGVREPGSTLPSPTPEDVPHGR